MHILIGFFVAALLLYWWARGSIIVAIMGALVDLAFIALWFDGKKPEAWLLPFLIGVGVVLWLPAAWRKHRRRQGQARDAGGGRYVA